MYNITYNDLFLAKRLAARIGKQCRYLFTLDSTYFFMEYKMQKRYKQIAVTMQCKIYPLDSSNEPVEIENHKKEHHLLTKLIKQDGFRVMISKPEDFMDDMFHEFLPKEGIQVNDKQRALTKEIFNDLQRGKTGLFEVSKEIKKDIPYLIACIAIRLYRKQLNPYQFNAPIIITTPSITKTYTQTIIKKLDFLSELLMKHRIIDTPFITVVRKGKGDYLCDTRLYQYMAYLETSINLQKKELLNKMKQLNLFQNSIDLGNYPELANIQSKINVPRVCDKHCPNFSDCRYQTYMKTRNKLECDFIICTHHSYLQDTYLKNKNQKGILPTYSMSIVIETKEFCQTAQQKFIFEYNEEQIDELIRILSTFSQNKMQILKYMEQIEMYEQLISDCFDRISIPYNYNFIIQKKEPITLLFGKLYQKLNDLKQYIDYKSGAFQITNNVLKQLQELMSGDMEYHLERLESGWKLYGVSKKNPLEVVWKTRKPTILFDTTMSDYKGFDYFKKKLGFDTVLLPIKEHSFIKKDNKPILYIKNELPSFYQKNYLDAIVKELIYVIHTCKGNTIIYVKSYQQMIQLYDIMKDYFYDSVGYRSKSNSDQMDRKAILFTNQASVTDTTKHFIFVSLPFPYYNPYLERIGKEEKDSEMLLNIKRVIQIMDGGQVTILDRRVNRYEKKIQAIYQKL